MATAFALRPPYPTPRLPPALAAVPPVRRRESAPFRAEAPAPAGRTPVEVALDVLEGRYKPLIVWHLFWGSRPFCELMRLTNGISKKALRRELSEMERFGLVRREVRFEAGRSTCYSLTPVGESLKPVVGALYQWGLYVMKRPLAQDALVEVPESEES